MTIRKILQEPDPILRQISQPIETVGTDEKQLMDDMLETMYDAPGIGLAAIQIGVPKRVIVLDISKEENKKNPMFFVNPVIKNKSKDMSTYNEGCLSLISIFVDVERPSTCEVEYLDYNGEKKILKCNGLLATCIQHEMDHLNGVLMVDYLSKLKKTMIIKKLFKQKSKAERIVI
tara:strand:- start:1240 stop:1764 length:525 start_codon:yes stop_codon:yes gene_type:complete